VVADGEENESTGGLDEERLFLFGKVDLANKLAVYIFGVRSCGRVLTGLGGVDFLALGEETGIGEVVISLGEVDLASVLLGRRGVDVDAGESGGHLLGRGLEVVLCYGRHGCDWCGARRGIARMDDGYEYGAEGMQENATVAAKMRKM